MDTTTSVEFYMERGVRFQHFPKPTMGSQKIFHLPVLGWVTMMQFTILIGIGIPGMYIMLNSVGLEAAPIPLAIAFIFAKFRPPLMGWEGRLYCVINFRIFGAKARKQSAKARKYKMPSAEGGVRKAEPDPEVPIEIPYTDRPYDIRISLPKTIQDTVTIKMDGIVIDTTYPDSNDTVHVRLYPDDMRGERTIEVWYDGSLVTRNVLVFTQAS